MLYVMCLHEEAPLILSGVPVELAHSTRLDRDFSRGCRRRNLKGAGIDDLDRTTRQLSRRHLGHLENERTGYRSLRASRGIGVRAGLS